MRVLQVLLASLLCAGVCWSYEDKTVAQWLTDNGYSDLVQLLQKAGLYQVLGGNGPFTVFAPTNAAFAKLDQAGWDAVNKTSSQLLKVLKYHVVPEFVLETMLTGFTTKKTMAGQDLNLTLTSGFMANGAHVSPIPSNKNIICNNGVIQPIDTVLLPPVSGDLNIAQLLLRDDQRVGEFFLALTIMDLTELLEVPGSEFTVFAPNDTAFLSFDYNSLAISAQNRSHVFKEIYKYHIVPGTKFSADLRPHVPVYTLHGRPLTITKPSSGLMIDKAHVIEADIAASNGVIHIIDHFLVPSDLLKPAS